MREFNTMRAINSLLDNNSIYSNWVLRLTASRPWTDKDDKSKILGTKLTLVILEDHITYPFQSPENPISNEFEKIMVKIPKVLNLAPGCIVQLINPRGKIYGEFNNQLSTIADDVKVVKPVSNS